MKKLFTVLAAALMISVSASAQHEIGGIVGGMNGVSYKYWFNDNLALQADLAVGLTRAAGSTDGHSWDAGMYDFTINPNALYHFELPMNFKIYTGGGLGFGLVNNLDHGNSHSVMGKFGLNAVAGVSYDFVDNKTIRAMAVFTDTAGCIKGERLTVNDTETSFYHIDEVLYSDKSGTFLGCTDYMEKNDALIKQKEATFKDNQFITPILGDDGVSRLAVTTVTTIPFEYELGVTLNYKTTEKTFSEAAGKKFRAMNSDWTVKNVKAGSFSIRIDAETDNKTNDGLDLADQENRTQEQMNKYLNTDEGLKAEITLKDGTKISAQASSQNSTEADGHNESSWILTYCTYENAGAMYAIDANEIVSVTCGGTELIK